MCKPELVCYPTERMELAKLHEKHKADEAKLLRRALVAEQWSLRGAARRLGVAVSTLQYMLETHHSALEAERRAAVVKAA